MHRPDTARSADRAGATASAPTPSGPAGPAPLLTLTTAVIAGLALVVLAGMVTGIFDAPVVGDPGAVVRWAAPAVGVLQEIAVALTLGALVAVLFLLPDGRDRSRALVVAGVGAMLWTVTSLADLLLTFADVLGGQASDGTFGAQLGSFLTDVPLGRVLAVTVAVAAVVAVLALLVRTPTGAAWTTVLVVAAFALRSLTGHSSGASGHNVAVSAIFLHLVGAATWVGVLLALAALRAAGGLRGPALVDAVARFSPVAAWCLVIVAYSGVASAVVRLGGWDGLTTSYGTLVLAKVVGIAAVGLAGLAYRRALVQRLRADAATLRGRPTRAERVAPAVLAAGAERADGGARAAGGATGAEGAAAADGGVRAEAAGRASVADEGLEPVGVGRRVWCLVSVELALMGAVVGIAGALGASSPPVPEDAGAPLTPAQIVTGELLPPVQTAATWFTQWRWDVLMALVVVAGAVVYVRWVARLRRRGDAWSAWRTAAWCTAMVVMFWVTSGGPAVYGHVLFSAHMVQHMVLAMVVPLFLAMSAPVTLALRALPKRHDGSRGPREWLLILVHSRWGSFFARPIVAAVNFAGSMIVFYYTPLFEWSLTTHVGHLGMVVHFSLAGYLFANALIGIDPGPRRPGYPMRLLLLFATMAFHAFFGVTLVTSEVLLVPEWFGLLGRTWGASAIADQQVGGSVAWSIGEIPTMLLAVVVAVRWAKDDERAARRRDRRVDRSGDSELDDYNAMLARLAERD